MYLKTLSLINFKNYEQIDLEFSPKINCFIGNNGVGKTNILDAIYYLSFCKSFLNSADNQNIKHGSDFFVIQGNYLRNEKEENIYCGFKRNVGKQFKKNKKEYEKLAEHIGYLPLVMISPGDYSLITEGSAERRKFIDGVISQLDKHYLEILLRYNRALEQRNALLKEFAKARSFDYSMLEIWDEQLIVLGEKIFKKREEFIQNFLAIFQKYYSFISYDFENIELIYQSQLHNNNFRTLLRENIEKDRILQYSSVGIHKDDLVLNLAGFPIKKIGSQGQQKTYLVALKLAQFEFIKNFDGFHPILLLDDIFDKLDELRMKQILKLVSDQHFGQIFITDTNREHLKKIISDIGIENKLFYIADGQPELI